MYATPAPWRIPHEIIELILFQVIGTKYLDPVCTSSRFFEFLEKDNQEEFNNAEWHRRRLRCVCAGWKRFLDREGSRWRDGGLELDNSVETMEKMRRTRRIQYGTSIYNCLVQPTQWEILCGAEDPDLERLARHIHLHPRLRRLGIEDRGLTQTPLSQKLTVTLLANITFLSVNSPNFVRPIITFGESPVTLPALQTLLWHTCFNYAEPFPFAILDLPSLRHLSLQYDPACVQVLDIGRRYPKLVSLRVFAALDTYAPLRFPSLAHFPQLEELSLNKPFDPDTPTLIPPYHPLQRLHFGGFSVNDLIELFQRILRDSPKHLRRISVDDSWAYRCGKLCAWRALAAESEAKNVQLHDCLGLDLSTALKAMG